MVAHDNIKSDARALQIAKLTLCRPVAVQNVVDRPDGGQASNSTRLASGGRIPSSCPSKTPMIEPTAQDDARALRPERARRLKAMTPCIEWIAQAGRQKARIMGLVSKIPPTCTLSSTNGHSRTASTRSKSLMGPSSIWANRAR